MSKIVGVTYPIPKRFMDRFFKKGKDVFVKPATVWKELKPGMKFVFYQSHEDTGFVGEARIKRVVLSENPMQFFETFGDRVFLTKDELKEYMKSQERWGRRRESKKKKLWMAIELEDVKKYDKPIKPKRLVPVGGQYLRE
ncbi:MULTISPECIES: DUF365 domain-containing protein [Archaeoglobus]|uniref:DUF365 domain-containing protein n=1 Tax=Archaeoglobus fulgidus (strain ATCC 49558 / DSM 4304 / JCM 9628 / NBRC 100126 / VC-16) TaxID=224325 RepID=O30319_ARCFU|nr:MULTISPECIES: DUF365 domain-containing protein [Archaeoglobus]AAB91313.1 conserved hypothetical protein [Archaeoglobus fulgidus DSM 4304]MDI3497824.1 hypothetical protein [Archaeoglobus sp.]